jgi:SAM-dependent MidA family methyltransferase
MAIFRLDVSGIPDFLDSAFLAAPGQCLTFAEWMERVLYDPVGGYYNRALAPMGQRGDYVTSPQLSADFGELVAVQLEQFWQALDQPQDFTVMEMGAGLGVLAADVLRYCQAQFPEFFQALHYGIIERAPTLKQRQQETLSTWMNLNKVSWWAWDEIPVNSMRGCFFSNELVDAFPVHRVRLHQGQLQEIYVRLNSDKTALLEEFGPLSTPGLEAYFQQIGIKISQPPYPEGYTTEVNLAALNWITTVAHRLHQGFVLTIDYGYPASTYYHPSRSQGTIQAYYQHQHHNQLYLHLGQQDLTAHVDFTTLQIWGEQQGLTPLLVTHQAPWLMALGLGERLLANNQTTASELTALNEALRRRNVLQQLIDPLGLGGLRVLLQSKQVESLTSLKILSMVNDLP